jgi:hypothetical protein
MEKYWSELLLPIAKHKETNEEEEYFGHRREYIW